MDRNILSLGWITKDKRPKTTLLRQSENLGLVVYHSILGCNGSQV